MKIPASLTEPIVAWQSKRLPNENIRPLTTLNKSFSPKLDWHNLKMRLEFKGSCFKFLFVNAIKIYQLRAKDSEIKSHSLCLGNISKILKLTT